MSADRTFVTELATGLGMVGCADVATAIAVRPGAIANLPTEGWDRLEQLWDDGSLRPDFEHGFDVHVAYKRKLHEGVDAELFFDIFNAYNRQGTARVDDTYAPQYSQSVGGGGGSEQNVNPISGGSYEDLVFAKTIDANGVESSTPLGRNPNFGRTTARYAPASAQVGFRVTF